MKYPQSLFTKKIKELIPIGAKSIVDAPCGSGETSYELAQYFPNATITGVDISEKNIIPAKRKFQVSNLKFQQADIHGFVEKAESLEIFCLINSLFLLPRPKQLLSKISQKLKSDGQLILILPNPESTNFKRYQKIAPEVNTFILEHKNYDTFFAKFGLKMTSCEGIVRVPIYGRWDTKLLYPVRDSYLFWLESRSLSEDYAYFSVKLSRY